MCAVGGTGELHAVTGLPGVGLVGLGGVIAEQVRGAHRGLRAVGGPYPKGDRPFRESGGERGDLVVLGDGTPVVGDRPGRVGPGPSHEFVGGAAHVVGAEIGERRHRDRDGERHRPVVEEAADISGEHGERHPVPDPGLGAAEPARQCFHGDLLADSDEPGDRVDFFTGGEIGSLDVLDEHRLDRLDRGERAYETGYLAEPEGDGGGVTAVPGDDAMLPAVVGR